MLTTQKEGRRAMLVHNRTTTVALLVAAGAVVLLGFGCDEARTPPETAGTDVSDVTWTTYESPTLGIRVPYPEGWYVEERRTDDGFVQIFVNDTSIPNPIPASDAPVRVLITSTVATLDDARSGYDPTDNVAMRNIGERETLVAEYLSLLGDGTPRTAYHWIDSENLVTVDGARDDAVVASMVASMRGGSGGAP